jgi:hypothetical protein
LTVWAGAVTADCGRQRAVGGGAVNASSVVAWVDENAQLVIIATSWAHISAYWASVAAIAESNAAQAPLACAPVRLH